jgi:hypothetical protein
MRVRRRSGHSKDLSPIIGLSEQTDVVHFSKMRLHFISAYFFKHDINIDIYLCISTHIYKYMYIHLNSMSQFILEIHKIHQQ